MKFTRLICCFVLGAIGIYSADSACAQCATCPIPTVAYSPVVAQPATVYQTYRPTTGWYPGMLLDRIRARWWGATTTTTAGYTPYTAAYTPTVASYAPTTTATTFTAAYAPTHYTAAYQPTYPPSYMAGYQPSVSYMPATTCPTCAVDPCACQTASKAVVMRPLVETCPTCCVAPTTASYVESAGVAGCPTCSASYSTPVYESPSAAPATPPAAEPRPALPPNGTGSEQTYRREPPENSVLEPTPMSEDASPSEPAESGADETNTSTYFESPALHDPRDRRAQTPTVPVWRAVYHKRDQKPTETIRHTSLKAGERPTLEDVEREAQAWTSASR